MADTASNSAALHRGKGIGSGLPLSMTPEEIAVAKNHVITAWWPQLCRSSRMTDTGMFEEGWYNDAGLLDIHNPAFWKILNALGTLYGKVYTRYPTDGVQTFRVRWQVAYNEDMIYLRAEPMIDRKANVPVKGFRVKSPRSGWLDFQMEIDVLRAHRDAADETMDPEDAAIAPKMVIAGDAKFVHSATFRPTGGPAFSRAQQKDIAERIDDALLEDSSRKRRRLAALSEDEQTSAKVSMWITDTVPHHSLNLTGAQQPEVSTFDRLPKNGDGVGLGLSLVDQPGADASIIPDMEDPSDIEEVDADDWVKVGDGDELDDYTVAVPSTYKYKKADATPARKGWFGWFY